MQKPQNASYQKYQKPLYEGKASRLYEVVDNYKLLIIERKDDVTKLDGQVRDRIEGKGSYTNRISNALFRLLEQNGVPTHFVQELNNNETLIRRAEQFPLEVIVRNYATGSLCKRLPFVDRTKLRVPLVELDYKSDEFHDPLINDEHALLLGAVDNIQELTEIREMARKANTVLKDFFAQIGIILVDFKLEFGRLPDHGGIIIIDEISPDTCRFWDAKTQQSLDKDVFRNGQGNDATYAAYREIFERLTTVPAQTTNT